MAQERAVKGNLGVLRVSLDALGRELFFDKRIVAGIIDPHRDVRRVALIAGAGVGDLVEGDRAAHSLLPVKKASRNQHAMRRGDLRAVDQCGMGDHTRQDLAAITTTTGRAAAEQRFDFPEQCFHIGAFG